MMGYGLTNFPPAAGLGTDGLAEHADKIEAGLNRMGRGMDSAGRSIRTGLVVVGIGIGIGLAVIGTGMILQALTNQPRRRRRRKRPGEGGPENVLGDDISYSQDED